MISKDTKEMILVLMACTVCVLSILLSVFIIEEKKDEIKIPETQEKPAETSQDILRHPRKLPEAPVDRVRKVFDAVCQVESNGNTRAYNASEDAKGIAQIRPIMVKDVNRIVRQEMFKHNDAWDKESSYKMFRIYVRHYYPNGTPEIWARAWNGGPRGPHKSSTERYGKKVIAVMN